MKILVHEKISPHKYKTSEGYLVCVDSVLARTGKQTYTRDEIFKDGKDETIEVDRPEEEVFSEETMASFENKPLTIEHPEEDVTPDNYREYANGFIRDVRRGEENGKPVMLGTLVVTDREAIDAIESGKLTDLSCGYDCDIEDEPSPKQRNIRGNHVALCKEGRAGNARVVDSVKDSKTIARIAYVAPIGYVQKNASNHRVDTILVDTDGHRSYDVKFIGNPTDLDKFLNWLDEEGILIKVLKKDSVKDGEGILSAGQEAQVKRYCHRYEVDFNKVYKAIEEMNRKYPRMKIDDIIESVLDDIVSGVYDSVKDVEPRAGEGKEEFIERFMSETKEEYPDIKQRYAVANSYWERKDSVEDAPEGFDKDYALQEKFLKSDINVVEQLWKMNKGSASDLFQRLGYKKEGNYTFRKNDKGYQRVVEFRDFDDIRYYVLKNGKIPVGWTVTKRTYWGDSLRDIDPYAEATEGMEEELETMEEKVDDAYLKLPHNEDEVYLYRDYRGQNIYVEYWGSNKYQVTAERDNFKEKYMTEEQVADYLDEMGARFTSVQRDSVKDIPVGFDPRVENRRIISWKNIHTPGSLKEELVRWLSASPVEKKDLENRIKTHVDEIFKDYQHDKMKVDKKDLSTHYTKYNSIISEINNKLKTNYRLFDSKLDKIMKVVKTVRATKDSSELTQNIKNLETASKNFIKTMTNEEEKQQYSSLYDLTQKIIDLSEKEISSAKDENKDVAKESICSQLLTISEKLKKSADLAENASAKTKLLTLSKELYRCYDRNRKY